MCLPPKADRKDVVKCDIIQHCFIINNYENNMKRVLAELLLVKGELMEVKKNLENVKLLYKKECKKRHKKITSF